MFFYTPSVGSAYGDMQHLRDRRRLRAAGPQRPPLVGAPDGARRRPAPGPGLLRRRLQDAARVQLGHRRDAALLTLVLSFTGYLLPWDQLSYWAVTVGTNLVQLRAAARRNAAEPADRRRRRSARRTLLRFYALHVAVLPVAVFVVLCASTSGGCARTASPCERPSSADVREEAADGPRRTGRGPMTMPQPTSTAAGPAARRRRPRVGHRRGAARRRHRVHLAAPAGPPRRRRARHVAAVVLALGVAFAAPLRGLANPNLTPRAGQGAVVLRRPPGAALALRSARRRHPRPAGAVLIFVLLPYIDRNPATGGSVIARWRDRVLRLARAPRSC